MMNRLFVRPVCFMAICMCAAPVMAQSHVLRPTQQVAHAHADLHASASFKYLDMPAPKKSKFLREAVVTNPPADHVSSCTRANSKSVQTPRLNAPMV